MRVNSKGARKRLTERQSKDSYIIQKVQDLLLTGRRFSAKDINTEANTNDARKIISTLLSRGWHINKHRFGDGRKEYWLSEDARQLNLFGDEMGPRH